MVSLLFFLQTPQFGDMLPNLVTMHLCKLQNQGTETLFHVLKKGNFPSFLKIYLKEMRYDLRRVLKISLKNIDDLFLGDTWEKFWYEW